MAWSDVENTGGKKEKIPYTKFPEGGTRIRILDGEPYSFWQHWFPKQNTAATCLGKDCPVCNVIAQAKANKVTPIYNSSHRHALRIWNYTTKPDGDYDSGANLYAESSDVAQRNGRFKRIRCKSRSIWQRNEYNL